MMSIDKIDHERHGWVETPTTVARSLALRALERRGTPEDIAQTVCESLLAAEFAGLTSHGLMRLADYLEDIAQERLVPAARPDISYTSPFARRVDGRWGFGAVAAEAVTRELARGVAASGFVTLGLVRANHIGRLAPILSPLAQAGYVAMAFVNYLGAGQKVAPWGGSEPRFCTNPVAFALPGQDEDIVVDMTTSAVAEGKIRTAALAGVLVPEGWLVDAAFKAVTDPRRLYSSPPTAMIAPFGGSALGYKGTSLALVTEVLAGIVSGAGFVQPGAARGGNGGFFLAFRADALGVDVNRVRSDVAALVRHLESCPSAPGFDAIRLPRAGARTLRVPRNLRVPRHVLQSLQQLAERPAQGEAP